MNLSKTRNSTLIGVGVLCGMLIAVVAAVVNVMFMDQAETNTSRLLHSDVGIEDGTASTRSLATKDYADLPQVEEIVQTLQLSRNFEREVVLYDLMALADREQLEELMSQLGSVDSESLSNEILRGAIRKLADLDPSHSLNVTSNLSRNQQQLMTEVIFDQWAVSDLDEALNHTKELDELGRNAALEGILRSRIDLSDPELRDIARKLGNEQRALDEFAYVGARSAIDDLGETWNQVLAVHGNDSKMQSDLQKQLLLDVATAYVTEVGANALQKVLASMANRESRVYVVGRLLEDISRDDPSRALHLATSVDALDRDILESVVRNWAKSDGLLALKAAQEVDAGGNRLQRAAIDAWADADPDSLLDQLDRLPENLRERGMQLALESIARKTPMSAIELLDGIEDDFVKGRVMWSIVRSWSDDNPTDAFEWTKSNSTSPVQMVSMQSMILRKMAQTDPATAMEVALAEDPDESGVGLEAQVIEELSTVNLDQAISMMDQVRNDTTRTAARTSIGTALVRQGKADEAIKLVQEEPLRFQRNYYTQLTRVWIETDYQDLMGRWDELPEDEGLLMNVTAELASGHWSKAISLTPEEKELVRKHLPESWAEAYLE